MFCAKEFHNLNIHRVKKYLLCIWFQSVICMGIKKVFTPQVAVE